MLKTIAPMLHRLEHERRQSAAELHRLENENHRLHQKLAVSRSCLELLEEHVDGMHDALFDEPDASIDAILQQTMAIFAAMSDTVIDLRTGTRWRQRS